MLPSSSSPLDESFAHASSIQLSDEVDDLETELKEARQALRECVALLVVLRALTFPPSAHKDVVESLNKRKRMTRKEEG